MKHYIFILIIIFVLGIVLLVNRNEETLSRICFSGACLNLEISDTPEERAYGLMLRETIRENSGMLFIFEEEGTYPFWMENTLIPLDIIWVNEEFKIVHIEQNVQPCAIEQCVSYDPKIEARYVIETNAGFVEKNKIEAGDFAELKII